MDEEKLKYLQQKADEVRKVSVEMMGRIGVGHIGGVLSIIDVLTVLYYDKMKINPEKPKMKNRDRLIVSKGHAGPALYSVLATKGYFPMEEIKTLNRPGTNLPSHCDMNKTIGIDMTAGSLGQGLSAAVGMAIAAKMDDNRCKIYCIIGDGESQEGQIWEAAMYAGSHHLNNLIVFLDNNKMQIDDYTDKINSIEPIGNKWKAFNFNVITVNGHNHLEIAKAIDKGRRSKNNPTMIILNTIKGYGFPLAISKGVGSHNFSITEAEWREFVGKKED